MSQPTDPFESFSVVGETAIGQVHVGTYRYVERVRTGEYVPHPLMEGVVGVYENRLSALHYAVRIDNDGEDITFSDMDRNAVHRQICDLINVLHKAEIVLLRLP